MTQLTGDIQAPILDVPDLMARVDNDEGLLSELLELFNEECPRIIRSLGEAVSQGEVNRIGSISHTLKGMLANLSAMRAAFAASRLEEIARAGERSAIEAACAALESEMGLLLAQLDSFSQTRKKP